jgi:hypothetical protein
MTRLTETAYCRYSGIYKILRPFFARKRAERESEVFVNNIRRILESESRR